MQLPYDTRDIKKRSAPKHAPSTGPASRVADDIEDEKYEHKEVNTAPGKILERVRSECGLTRKELAQKLSIKEAQIAAWENGTVALPGPMKSRITHVLGKPLK